MSAFVDPATWIPAAAGVVVLAGGWDQSISDWATTNTPIYGSEGNADAWSNRLLAVSYVSMLATTFLVVDDNPWTGRLEATAVQHSGALLASGLTYGLKVTTNRTRPDSSDDKSFPSGHTSKAFSFATSTRWNVRSSSLSGGMQAVTIVTTQAVAAGTAWSRVEAGRHYLSDVLVGAALGRFATSILLNALLPAVGTRNIRASAGPDGVMIYARIPF